MDPITTRIAFGAAGAGGPGIHDILASGTSPPYVCAFPWDSSTGLGTRYTSPSTLPPDRGYDIAVTSDNSAVFLGHADSPFISAYSYTVGVGVGTKYANPSTLPPSNGQASQCVAVHPSDNAVAIGTIGQVPYLNVYQWSSSGFGAKYADMPFSIWPGGYRGQDIAWHPTGNAISFATYQNQLSTHDVYTWSSSSGVGTRYSYPGNPGHTRYCNCSAFSPDGNYIAVGLSGSPYLQALNWSNSSGFGSYLTNPSSSPGDIVNSVKFSPDGSYVGVATNDNPVVYDWSGGFGSKYEPNPGWGNTVADIAFTPNNDAVAGVGLQNYNYYVPDNFVKGVVYEFSSSGFGTAHPIPSNEYSGSYEQFGGVRFTN
jgi:WD40 repeat protein